MRQRSLFWLFVWSGLGIAILLGLGTWQLLRLSEKQNYLAELDTRMAAAPTALGEALQRARSGTDMEFLKVTASGRYGGGNQYKLATFEGGPGWQVLTLFASDDGVAVLVDRGTISAAMRDKLPPLPAGTTAITGVVREYNRGQGLFDADNDPAAGNWYWWDIPAMLGSLNIAPDAEVAPFVLQLLPQTADTDGPKPAQLVTSIPNNHLGYAITWYSLALCLAAMTALLARREIARWQA